MQPTTAKLRYHGTGGALFGVMFVNLLLTGITLGIYSAWAKNKLRVFHWGHTEVDSDRFAYHGTGGELFVGYLKAGLIMLVIGLGLGVLQSALAGVIAPVSGDGAEPVAAVVVVVAFYAALFVLIALAINSTRKYRLSRSSWRGIRFSFRGNAVDFVKLMARGTLLSIVTLGFYGAHFQNQLRAFFVENVRFGSEPFMYDGKPEPLFRAYVKAILLTIPTLGLYWIWYSAFKQRHFWNHTAMRGARFQSTITGGALCKLHLTNLLIVLLTLGIGTPWAIVRMHDFWCDNLALVGTVDWASIEQRALQAQALGEGLAEGFDVDVGIGM
jgi:uncharacterized membrane protein YjgN (DUF898 family)